MMKLKTILCPTDFSNPAAYAFEAAAALAHDHGARLVVLHVSQPIIVYGEMMGPLPAVEPEDCKGKIWAEFHKLEAANPKVRELRMESRVAEGNPARCILEMAREVEADMIVMGTHGRTGLGRVVMGSVAEQVLRRSSCPVMTVKGGIATLLEKGTPVEVCV